MARTASTTTAAAILTRLQGLNPTAFEKEVVAFLEGLGYAVASPGTGLPKGISLVAQQGTQRLLVRAKAGKSELGAGEVKSFQRDVAAAGNGGALFVTAGTISQGARKAAGKGIGLIDGPTLAGWRASAATPAKRRRPTRRPKPKTRTPSQPADNRLSLGPILLLVLVVLSCGVLPSLVDPQRPLPVNESQAAAGLIAGERRVSLPPLPAPVPLQQQVWAGALAMQISTITATATLSTTSGPLVPAQGKWLVLTGEVQNTGTQPLALRAADFVLELSSQPSIGHPLHRVGTAALGQQRGLPVALGQFEELLVAPGERYPLTLAFDHSPADYASLVYLPGPLAFSFYLP